MCLAIVGMSNDFVLQPEIRLSPMPLRGDVAFCRFPNQVASVMMSAIINHLQGEYKGVREVNQVWVNRQCDDIDITRARSGA